MPYKEKKEVRHRISDGATCLGSDEAIELDNNIKLLENSFWQDFLADAENNFKVIKDYEGFDFHYENNIFVFGIEPTYQFDSLLLIAFKLKKKEDSYIKRGRAFGLYGTGVVSTVKVYKDYQRSSKFTKFIDKWADLLKKELEGKDE